MKYAKIVMLAVLCIYTRCGTGTGKKLPILGKPVNINGVKTYPEIHNFKFVDQENQTIEASDFENKIYVADFIFLRCSTICPLMNTEMLKVYKTFEDDKRVSFLSHTIDPKNDSIPRLRAFSDNLGVSPAKWHFVTGNVDSIYTMARRDYYTIAYPDSVETDGLVHGGGLLLVDKNRNIRGVYDGTDPSETERLIADIKLLLEEQF